jgi:hypothetical protein
MASMSGGIGATDIPKSVRYLLPAGSLLIQLSLHDQGVVCAWMTRYSERIEVRAAVGPAKSRSRRLGTTRLRGTNPVRHGSQESTLSCRAPSGILTETLGQ